MFTQDLTSRSTDKHFAPQRGLTITKQLPVVRDNAPSRHPRVADTTWRPICSQALRILLIRPAFATRIHRNCYGIPTRIFPVPKRKDKLSSEEFSVEKIQSRFCHLLSGSGRSVVNTASW